MDARFNKQHVSVSLVLRAVEVWFVISAVEVVHGAVRLLTLEPLVGAFAARQIGVLSGSILVLVVAFLFRRWIGAANHAECLVVGGIWVLLTIGFEVFLGRALMHASWSRILSDYDLLNGGLMPVGLLVILFAPLIIRPRKHGLKELQV